MTSPSAIRVEPGDCRAVMARLKSEAVLVDAVVCDPPYHLTSIVKRFGKANAAPAQYGTDGAFARASRGFMGKEWDGGDVAFRVETWRAAFDVMRPGAHLVAFSGTRTYHRMACAIDDAGFEIRDQLAWVYGSGFPKSHDVANEIDKRGGVWRGQAGPAIEGDEKRSFGQHYKRTEKGAPISDAAKQWDGWGTALKPAWEPIVLARKPLIGTVVENVRRHGTGAINVDACRVASEKAVGWGGCAGGGNNWNGDNCGIAKAGAARPVYGRWPANIVHDGSDEVLAAFSRGAGAADRNSPARFFYAAKAAAEDRMGSKHPTVKPVSLLRWLVRLVTPPGGVALDPFAGTGTTGMACLAEGRRAILIEREPEYLADIARRIAFARGEGPLTPRATASRFDEAKAAGTDTPLFGGRSREDAAA